MKAVLAAVILLPGAAFACALPPSVILTMPTGYYIWGAGLTVALTAVLSAGLHLAPALQAYRLHEGREVVPRVVSSYFGFLLFAGLLGLGFLGADDPMHNLLTLVFWTGVWVALPLVSMLFGNLWGRFNPWLAPVRIARVLLGWNGSVGLVRLGAWPAVAGLLGFSWFQIVSLSPQDPDTLAWLMLGYWLVIFALAVAEGEVWLEQGEFLTLFFALISRIAPLWRQRVEGRVQSFAGWPGAQVLRMSPLSLSEMAFVTLILASLSFDGLSETFFWLGLVGQNPLEFGGRSAVQGVNTLGLLGSWAVTAAAIAGAFWLGRRWGGFAAGPVMLSFLAIAAGYHLAHHLITLMTAGQFTLAALNDPLFRGEEWLGLPPSYVSFGFLSDPAAMQLIYVGQFLAILGAHVLAVLLSVRLSGPQIPSRAHLPLTGLMVIYTLFGLWLLSTARGA